MSLSLYNKNALLYKLNRDKKISLGDYLYEALSLSQKYYKKSDGYFDITVGKITKDLYRFGEDERVPASKELEEAKVDFLGLSFNKYEASLQSEIKIDLESF